MNMATDHDAGERKVARFRVVAADERKPAKSPGAEAAARYRARKRGEPVPKRKPGPKPATATAQRETIRDLEARNRDLELQRNMAQERVARRESMLRLDDVARELLARDDPQHDTAARQDLLGDVLAAIEARHEHWRN
jgi:hypothetical protein